MSFSNSAFSALIKRQLPEPTGCLRSMSSPKLTKLTPECYKEAPKPILEYSTAPTQFGNCLAAFRGASLCYLSFFDKTAPLERMMKLWPKATFTETDSVSPRIVKLFEGGELDLLLKGTNFELEVWEALLKIEKGATVCYEDVAKAIKKPKATRAAARAIARNSIAYFVPCHRVIRKDGSLHKYGGGAHLKVKMLREEGAI